MPFIKPRRRELIDNNDNYYTLTKEFGEIQPGDRCYFYYKPMVDKWKANPRWTTAHEIYKDILHWVHVDEDDEIAQLLAWQCFFYFQVLPYEQKKQEENGDIT